MEKHIFTPYDVELTTLSSDVYTMGDLVAQQLAEAVLAISEGDARLAETVHQTEKEINRLDIKVDKTCQHILAVRQPAASDLRYILAIARLAHDLERAGDEAKKVARLVQSSHEQHYKPFKDGRLKKLAQDVNLQLKRALDAFRDVNVDDAVEVIKGDKLVDQSYAEGIRDTIKMMEENPEHIDIIMDKIWALRSIERIGDHAINIAEQVIYLKHGTDVRHRSVKALEEKLDT